MSNYLNFNQLWSVFQDYHPTIINLYFFSCKIAVRINVFVNKIQITHLRYIVPLTSVTQQFSLPSSTWPIFDSQCKMMLLTFVIIGHSLTLTGLSSPTIAALVRVLFNLVIWPQPSPVTLLLFIWATQPNICCTTSTALRWEIVSINSSSLRCFLIFL